MSIENISKFQQAAEENPELLAKVQRIQVDAARAAARKIAELAAEVGTPFTPEEFIESAAQQSGELADEQLQAVAGGNWEPNAGNICASIFTLGALCAVMGLASLSPRYRGGSDDCQLKHPDGYWEPK